MSEINDYRIEKTKPSDWSRIKKGVCSIEKNVFEEDVQQDEEDIESTFIDEISINYCVYDSKENIVAYMMSSPIEDYPDECEDDSHYGKKDSLYLESIAVLPKHAGNGLCRKILNLFMSDAKKEGYTRITMHSTSQSMDTLVESLGFKKMEYFEEWVGERPAWYVEKEL